MSTAAIQAALSGAKRSSSGWARMPCPYCEADGHRDRKASMGVSPSGIFSCFRCGAKGKLDGEWEERGEGPHQASVTPEGMAPPDGYDRLWEEPAWSADCYAPARAYLSGRGLRRETLQEMGIGAAASGLYHHRVIVPVLDGETWVGWVGRTWAKQADMPYVYPPGAWRATALYNRAALLLETDVPVLVVEGVFDAIYAWPDAVAVLGKPSDAQVEMLSAAKRPVVVALDGDAWVEGQALSMRLQFGGARAGSLRLPPGKDPDELPRNVLSEAARASVGKIQPVSI